MIQRTEKGTAILLEASKKEAERAWKEVSVLAEEADDFAKSARGALNRAIKSREKAPYAPGVREWFVKISDCIWEIYTILDKMNAESEKVESICHEVEQCKDLEQATKLEEKVLKGLSEARKLHLESRRIHTRIFELENKVQSVVWGFIGLHE